MTRHLFDRFAIAGLAVVAFSWPISSSAQLALADKPVYLSAPVPPSVMLDISKDQQLYKKAYNDYSDLDGDGQLETTYKNTIDYYGYFDPAKCYTYQNNRFEPAALATSDSTLPTFQRFNTDTGKFESVTLNYYYNSDLDIYVLADDKLAPTDYYNPGTKKSVAWEKKTPDSEHLPKHYCNGTTWSGNFLNWVSMARIDAVRKLLYGGLRQKDMDTKALTVLERTYLPTDAHSWAKYYNGDDIGKLTPITTATLTPTAITSSSSNTLDVGTKTFTVTTSAFSLGDQVIITDTSDPTHKYMIGAVSCVDGSGIKMFNSVGGSETCNSGKIKVAIESGGVFTIDGDHGSKSSWTLKNWTKTGISFCNTTLNGTSPNDKSQTNTNPPLIRYAAGNYGLWAANERWQCMTRSGLPSENTDSLAGGTGTNGNRASQSGSFANSLSPPAATDYNARIKACDSNWLGNERCKLYPSGNYKPVGLLQSYGESGLLKFGLMTGSYDKNISGGVLRKNISSITNEINVAGDGTFTTPSGGNIITTLSKLRIYGYYSAGGNPGSYLDSGGDSCSWQQVSLTQGSCRSWGNPMAEIYYESLRYLAGQTTPTGAYVYDDTASGSADVALGLPLATWSDPLTKSSYCSPLSVLVFNASVSTNEYAKSSPTPSSTQGTKKSDLAGIDLVDINAKGNTAASRAKEVGDGEGITGKSYFIGKTLQDGAYVPATSATDYEMCTAKKVSSLGEIYGICPEGPTLEGSYLMPGLAYQAHINRIRTDVLPTSGSEDKSVLKVATYGVQLATNVPRLAVPVPGSKTGQQVVIQPAYRLVMAAGNGGGALVDMQVIYRSYSSTVASGLIYLNWEDSEQGGDYDQDVWGILRYCVTTTAGGCDASMGLSGTTANSVYVMTNTVAQSTNQPQGFGYVISGTTQDGPHFHSGIESFKFDDPQNITIVSPATPSTANIGASGGCNGCIVGNPATIAKYALSSTTGNSLQDPLYYAAKWGAFKDSDGNLKPDVQSEWDSKKGDGTEGSDGTPDTYFLVSNPLTLEKSLETAFMLIVKSSSASAVATSSTSLNTNTYIYQATFNPADWSGGLLAYKLNVDATLATTPEWKAGITTSPETRLDHITRVILTLKPLTQVGAKLDWDSLDPAQQCYLANVAVGSTLTPAQITYGKAVLDYLRGIATNEAPNGLKFRARVETKLGDIVDSNPMYVGTPQGQYEDPNLLSQAYLSSSTYMAWRKGLKDRTPIIYVGANDGMLHGFDASNGVEKLAFVPNAVYPNLKALISPTYNDSGASEHRFFVDGSPAIADAEFTSGWRTVLASGLGKGGRAVFALDVSDPSKFAETNTATVLWEFANTTTTVDKDSKPVADAAELGYVYGKPLIAKMNNGSWAAVFGNGYNSNSNKASLFIVFLENAVGKTSWVSGTDYIRIPVVMDGGAGTTNGLSTINAIDVNGDGKIDYVYGGDLLGNLWKFDVSDGDSTKWAVATITSGDTSGKQPLFVACTGPASGTSTNFTDSCPAGYKRQPITMRPELSFNPKYPDDVMIYFGTGEFLTSADMKDTTTQTMYGIWDKDTVKGTSARPDRSTLQAQSIVNSSIDGFRTFQGTKPGEDTISQDYSYPVDWTTQYGWYEDLPDSGERVVGTPKLVRGTLFYNTFIPTEDPCGFGGTGNLMAVDYATGGMPKTIIFLTGSTLATSKLTSGLKLGLGAGLGGTIIILPGSAGGPGAAVTSSAQGTAGSTLIPPGVFSGTRISWRELNP